MTIETEAAGTILGRLLRPERAAVCARPFSITNRGDRWTAATDARIILALSGATSAPLLDSETMEYTLIHHALFSLPERRHADAPLEKLSQWAGDPAWGLNGSAESRPGYIAGIVVNRTLLARALDGLPGEFVTIETGRSIAGGNFVRIAAERVWRAAVMEVTGLPAYILGNAGTF